MYKYKCELIKLVTDKFAHWQLANRIGEAPRMKKGKDVSSLLVR